MSKFLRAATFSGGITVSMYDGLQPQAVVYKTPDDDEKDKRRPSTVLQRQSFQSRAEMRAWVADYRPKE
jgi:hypothetical protein